MAYGEREPAEVVVDTVSKALGEDPMDLPPLEKTISSDALNDLFHEGNELPGAHVVFPYADVWVMVHSHGVVDVFTEYAATSTTGDEDPQVADATADEDLVVLGEKEERHALRDDELETLHDVVDEADDTEEAWEESIEYAKQK